MIQQIVSDCAALGVTELSQTVSELLEGKRPNGRLSDQECRQLLERLKQQPRYRQRQAAEGFFGSATPSSELPLKANTPEEKRYHSGGLKSGHSGHGRQSIPPEQADRVEDISVASSCPECGSRLEGKCWRLRSVTDGQPLGAQRVNRATTM